MRNILAILFILSVIIQKIDGSVIGLIGKCEPKSPELQQQCSRPQFNGTFVQSKGHRLYQCTCGPGNNHLMLPALASGECFICCQTMPEGCEVVIEEDYECLCKNGIPVPGRRYGNDGIVYPQY